MRKLVVAALMVMLSLAACGSDDNTTEATETTGGATDTAPAAEAPVTLSGKVNDEGTKDADRRRRARGRGRRLLLQAHLHQGDGGPEAHARTQERGRAPHTFTSTALGVDKELKPGETATVEITVPDADAVAFFCRFHQGGGHAGRVLHQGGGDRGRDASARPRHRLAPATARRDASGH